tara:strand:- start:256 stop:426 length:171 start_codon:yes stop_codon:yes gene_type:complete
LGILEKEERDQDNETGLNEGGGYRNVSYSASITHALFRFEYLPKHIMGVAYLLNKS